METYLTAVKRCASSIVGRINMQHKNRYSCEAMLRHSIIAYMTTGQEHKQLLRFIYFMSTDYNYTILKKLSKDTNVRQCEEECNKITRITLLISLDS